VPTITKFDNYKWGGIYMGLYDAMKDAVSLAQKTDNIELYRQLLDLSAQALELQAEVTRLKEENSELKKRKNMVSKIIRHTEPCITLKDDENSLYYCSHCWDSEQLLIQVNCRKDITFECPHCGMKGIYDYQKKQKYEDEERKNIARLLK